MARLILDTGVLIRAARGRVALETVVGATDDVTLPVIVVAEYLHGVLRTAQDQRRAALRQFLDDVLDCWAARRRRDQ